jgi:hypothetical protein
MELKFIHTLLSLYCPDMETLSQTSVERYGCLWVAGRSSVVIEEIVFGALPKRQKNSENPG